MIRLLYWMIVLIEVVLVLLALLLFIMTDSRSIKYIADKSFESTSVSYESIEGNIFKGLSVRKLAYDDKPLFDSALIRWNPLALLRNKITITQLDAQGIEIENILSMMKDFKSESSESGSEMALDFSLAVNVAHLDINPYVYEDIMFSSFVLETDKIEVNKNLEVDTNALYLKFDSDIVNVVLNGKIEKNSLFVENLELKNISERDITKLTRRLKQKRKNVKVQGEESVTTKSSNESFLKEIKVKHILGTMKPVQYGDLKIEAVTLHLYDGVIDPSNNFEYQVKKLEFDGKTNFGTLLYMGEVRDSNIYATGNIVLDKELFSKYSLPLNYKGLKNLPSTLRLNHDAVWIDIDHDVEKLLVLKSDFNLNATKAKHKLHYNYSKGDFTIKSDVLGNMTYANKFKLENDVLINKEGFSYGGKVEVEESKALPKVVTDYLLAGVNGAFKGDSSSFDMTLESQLLRGTFSMPKYKEGILELKSKTNNIALNKLIPSLPALLENEKMELTSKSLFNFKELEKSVIELKATNPTLDVDAQMNLRKPYKVMLKSKIKDQYLLTQVFPKFRFEKLQTLEGDVVFEESEYLIRVKNDFLRFFMKYDSVNASVNDLLLDLEGEAFNIQRDVNKALTFNANIQSVQKFLEKMQSYYDFTIPNIRGEAEISLKKQTNGVIEVKLKSPKLQYLSDKGVSLNVTNFYNTELEFSIDEASNFIIDSYQFKLDDNGYLNSFYSTKRSYLALKNDTLHMREFWLNDEIKLKGSYDMKGLRGEIKVDSNSYSLRTKDFALILELDLLVKVDGEKFDIEGDVDILGDTITYEVVGTSIVEDSDIIIMKDMIYEEESLFNNFKLYVKVNSKKPLRYFAENVNVEFFNKLSILKNYNQEMLVTGASTITKGFYQLEDKKFLLDESHLYFTGDLKKPLLDIKANYEKDHYNVHVFISGTTESPIVNFNSEPYLTQQEILSLILFDGTGSSSGNGAEAYTLLGGTFAKGLIKSLGIDVDHLLLGTDAQEELSLEIGKKVLDNVSILYLHKDGLDGAKVRIEHSDNFETDIIIQPPNTSSIEFLYKQDR